MAPHITPFHRTAVAALLSSGKGTGPELEPGTHASLTMTCDCTPGAEGRERARGTLQDLSRAHYALVRRVSQHILGYLLLRLRPLHVHYHTRLAAGAKPRLAPQPTRAPNRSYRPCSSLNHGSISAAAAAAVSLPTFFPISIWARSDHMHAYGRTKWTLEILATVYVCTVMGFVR